MNTMAKILWVIAIILIALTAAITLVSGIGTYCVAWNAEQFAEFANFEPYKPLYKAFVVLTTIIGLVAVVDVYGMMRRKKWAYLATLGTLVAGIIVGGTHVYYSTMLRGTGMPGTVRVYLSVLTLVVLLLLRIPGIWQAIKSGKPSEGSGAGTAAGLAMSVCGLAVVATPMWAGPTHTFAGYNWVNVLLVPLIMGGVVLMLAGISLLVFPKLQLRIWRRFLPATAH